VALIVIASLAQPVAAADPGWKVRVSGVWTNPDFSTQWVEDDIQFTSDADSALGFGFGVEYRVSERLGVEVAAARTDNDLNVTATLTGVGSASVSQGIAFTPYTAGVNIYLTPSRAVEFYVAPQMVYATFDDLRIDDEQFGQAAVDIDSDTGWGLNVGLDIRLGEGGWVVNGFFGYMDIEVAATPEDGDQETFDFDPIVAGLGIGYRF
jgi:outer membrane protein W